MTSLEVQGRRDEAALVRQEYQQAWRLSTELMTIDALR